MPYQLSKTLQQDIDTLIGHSQYTPISVIKTTLNTIYMAWNQLLDALSLFPGQDGNATERLQMELT